MNWSPREMWSFLLLFFFTCCKALFDEVHYSCRRLECKDGDQTLCAPLVALLASRMLDCGQDGFSSRLESDSLICQKLVGSGLNLFEGKWLRDGIYNRVFKLWLLDFAYSISMYEREYDQRGNIICFLACVPAGGSCMLDWPIWVSGGCKEWPCAMCSLCGSL